MKTKNPIKNVLQWWYGDPDHRALVFFVLIFTIFSVMVGLASESVWLGIFWCPLFILAVLAFGLALSLPVYILIRLFEGAEKVYKDLKRWAYTA